VFDRLGALSCSLNNQAPPAPCPSERRSNCACDVSRCGVRRTELRREDRYQ
jgi:hypothetical protein